MTNCSILILTKNEEDCIEKCLESISWSNDIVVYDSYSTDNTKLKASYFNVRFLQREGQDLKKIFGGDEASHRNWGLKNINFLNDWVLILDADEALTQKGKIEILEKINFLEKKNLQKNYAAFKIRRKDFLDGVHLKHVQATEWYIRLVKPDLVKYERSINCSIKVNGEIKYLSSYIHHYPFAKGLSHWIERHNSYSSFEANEIVYGKKENIKNIIFKAFFNHDITIKRASQKKLFYKLPFRPLVKFIFLYFLKFGFLDGKSGFKYSVLQAIYEYLICLKVIELKKN